MKNKLYILLFLAFLFSGTTLWAQQKATPKAGEGISSFLLRHNRSPKKYYDDFIELNKQKLGKNNVLKVGVTYVIPPVKKSTTTSAKTTPAKNRLFFFIIPNAASCSFYPLYDGPQSSMTQNLFPKKTKVIATRPIYDVY